MACRVPQATRRSYTFHMKEASPPAQRVAELRRLIDDANHRYHGLDDPNIADADYDALVRELLALEASHPDVEVYLASIDECLNQNAYIHPGLGDAGDRIFGTPTS